VNFFSELKRRNVYKVAVAYAVVGWLLIQVATQVFPFLEIPNWAIRLDSGLSQLAVTPFFLPYMGDPRFTALCQKLNVQLPSASPKP
jgi:hypothetical protein